MRKTIILLTVLLCYFLSSSSQENAKNKIKNFKVWISLNTDSRLIRGALSETKDSSILVSEFYGNSKYSLDKLKISEINYRNINVIQTRKKSSIKDGVLTGTISGILIGALIGFIDGNDPPNQILGMSAVQKAGFGAVFLGGIGAGVGTLVGTFRLNIPINGQFENFNSNKIKLRKRSFK